ncbi:RabGAP/TBC [Xylona heveae TC161]|uniref:RabGAP/TBC n=1 Tax=Xylona heveae (strain CBS 132557 / TC161) TaxID=1328760 RepID=A0A165IQK9_XYLHT|nr:RabGAP/TBC [Xylona heveae TC161]KZF25240.1 RabGAP/TBC [Xylona heveae TC161]
MSKPLGPRRVSFGPRGDDSKFLKAIRYEETAAGEAPLHDSMSELRRPKTSPALRSVYSITRPEPPHDPRRDSGLAPSNSSRRFSAATDYEDAVSHLTKDPSSPIYDDSPPSPDRSTTRPKSRTYSQETYESATDADESQPGLRNVFEKITTNIPDGSLEDLSTPGRLEFSKRGSILIKGARPRTANAAMDRESQARRERARAGRSNLPQGRVLSADEEMLSQKVRSMYDHGGEAGVDWTIERMSCLGEEDSRNTMLSSKDRLANGSAADGASGSGSVRPVSINSTSQTGKRESMIQREPCELAGGIEDWENVHGEDVDRYGFILPKKAATDFSAKSEARSCPPEHPRPHRVSTSLQIASEAPRRKRTLRRKLSQPSAAQTLSPHTLSFNGRKSLDRSTRSATSLMSYRSYLSLGISRHSLRYAANRLPHNRNRRWLDEASDMLTLPPELAQLPDFDRAGDISPEMKKRERRREEKWRKMAHVVKGSPTGGKTVFEFDTNDPKLISRTWKGIPDRWRATAWHAFLTSSAKKMGKWEPDEDIIADYQRLLAQSSADDVQIDIDVPRTVSSHIMFRRRYRGGLIDEQNGRQRLLFRTLHALSLYYPEIGYVQGMASLAATLLCFYDEDMAFVMLVRMWRLRGLETLYRPGFDGLMLALAEFEKVWLSGSLVSQKLDELGIGSTAYGTRWYLTLFNYSIPFPAQLRVWDVFMLLGDPRQNPSSGSVAGGLDVLHATSAALIAGTRDILLDSDFENVMKVLTSWIPIKDEELLMKVAKAEWKKHRERRKP